MLLKSINRLVSKFSGQFSLRSVFIVPFVIQLFMVMGVVGWLSFRTGQIAVDDLISKLQSEVTAHIQSYLSYYLDKWHDVDHQHIGPMLPAQLNRLDTQNHKILHY